MINSDDVAGLAGLGPEQKFCMIEQLARKRLADARRAARQNDWPEFDDFDYMVDVLAAAQEFGITELAEYEMPWRNADDRESRCQMFRDEASRVSQRLLYRHGTKSATVALDHGTKEKISHWLTQMREAIQAADVSSEKKDRLFDLIDQLQAEVDRDRTPIHAAGELWVTLCIYMGEGAKRLDPVAQFLAKVGGALGLSKQAEDSQRKKLPPAKETKRIEGPKKPKDGCDRTLNDEIPF